MKKLVVYYSFDGNTKFIAQAIAEAVSADVLELKPKKEIKSHGFTKYFWGGKQVMMKEKPELLPFDKQSQEYDILFIGTPVWGFNYAPPLNTFFSNVNLKDKKIALFCCYAGLKGKTLESMRKCLLGNDIIGKIDFIEPLKHNYKSDGEKAKEWARNIIVGL